MIGLESEIVVDHPEIFNSFKNSACFDFGVIPNGYGWVFPKNNHLSVGVVSVSKKVKKMKKYLYNYAKTKQLDKNSRFASMRGWHIPYGPPKKTLFANEKGFIIGDAAGLTDPITGEGIFYALKEASIASQIISDKLLYNKGDLNDYNKALEAIRLDLAYAHKLQWCFYQFPNLSYTIMNAHGKRLGMNYVDIISGKTTYHALYKKLFCVHGIKTLFLGLINNNLGVFKKALNRRFEGEK
jgi:flavin-dependent dehydrogenase